MPGFDRTGPMGAGPMTGGRRGSCSSAAAENVPVYGGLGYYRGFRPGRGLRRGCSRGYGPYPPTFPISAGSEIDMLREEAGRIKTALETITARIAELEKQQSESSSS
ncbi:MAG TPA: hypothetical protein ENN06_11895 [Desulfobacteraceae bacterium]|nr:hypothetical protein [Desulfobacteraceae bacterium]